MARNVFNSVAVRKPSRNTFNLSHDVKFSGDMGELIPILSEECLPGDVWRLRSEVLVRLAPMLAPVMHKVNISVQYFFVPNRILWPNWESFISPPEEGSTPPAHPFINIGGTGPSVGSLGDYLGLPIVGNQGSVNAFPFAAYNKIWNDYYRDQNLQSAAVDSLVNGTNTNSWLTNFNMLRRRAWQHDYFTGSLPFAQKGQAVSIPVDLQGEVPVYRRTSGTPGEVGVNATWNNVSTPTPGTTSAATREIYGGGDANILYGQLYAGIDPGQFQSAGTINDLRVAMRTQEFLERQARGGSRYIEQIRMQFGVKSSDARLQRPEFIGSTSSPIVISEVLQTSESSETPLAEMAGHGIGAQSGKYFRYYCEEHGWIFAMLSVMPKSAYMQGLPRKFIRSDMFDYAWPVLAHIGEQEVLNKELYVADDGQNDDVFGYVPRYSEYRYIPSYVRGEMRTSLSYWHMARDFASRPTLSSEFVECDPTKRIFAVQDGNTDSLWMHAFHSIKCSRLLPKYGTPTL